MSENAVADDVWEALKDVVDPELGINIVDLGLVYDVHVEEGNTATVDMTGLPSFTKKLADFALT